MTGRFYFGMRILECGFGNYMLLRIGFRRKRVSWSLGSLIFFLVCIGSGCRERAAEISPGTIPVESTRAVQDDLGRAVNVPLKIDRVISLAPSLTEMIFAVGAGDRLVGVTTYCNYPPETVAIEKVGDTQTPNIERIVALKPQVVFVSTASQLEAFKNLLSEQKIAVYVSNTGNFESVVSSIRAFGELFDTRAKADATASELERKAIAIDQRFNNKPPVRVFVQISNDPLFTVGRGSFLTEVIERAGGVSVTKDVPTAYPKLSKETALALNPEAIVLSDSDDNREPNAVFKNSPAVKNGRIYRINADLISRPGPRLVDAMEQLAGHLHPETQK